MTKIERLHSLLELKEEDGSPKVNPIHVYTAIGFIEETKTEPFIYPTTEKGISLEYEIGKKNLEIIFEDDGITLVERDALDLRSNGLVSMEKAKEKALETLNWR